MRITSTLFVLFFCLRTTAQTPVQPAVTIPRTVVAARMPEVSDYNSWDVGASLGLAYPRTDISGSGGRFGLSLDVTKFLSHSMALQARFVHATLGGEDITRPEYTFHTTINYDLTLNAMLQLGNVSFLKQVPDLAFYATAGFGLIHYSPEISLNGGRTKLNGIYSQYIQTFDTFDYRGRTDFMLPVSIGAKYRLNEKISVTAEYSYRTTNTDKLDGFFKLLSSNDSYSFFNVGIVYHLGSNDKVIEWENPLDELYANIDMMRNRLDRSLRDSDADGVPDLYDKEPETPAGAKVYGNGVSIDSDEDGVLDRNDDEPFSPKHAKVDSRGKQIIEKPVVIEKPVTQPEVIANPPVDTQPVVTDNTRTAEKFPETLHGNEMPSVYFGFDSSRIDKSYYEALGKIAEKMRAHPQQNYRVIGVSDGGAKRYNIELSLRRAEAVKRHLVKYYNIRAERLKTEVQTTPAQESESSAALHRRVDILPR
jgi:outer membrane protein OmpA-like peptidoglycan-associated protein/opacity protein-like surface antigen